MYISSIYLKELNLQNASCSKQFSSCSEKRYSLIVWKIDTQRFFKHAERRKPYSWKKKRKKHLEEGSYATSEYILMHENGKNCSL